MPTKFTEYRGFKIKRQESPRLYHVLIDGYWIVTKTIAEMKRRVDKLLKTKK